MGDAKLETEQPSFDYSLLTTEARSVVQEHTAEIKKRMRRAAQDIVEIGKRLVDVQAKLDQQLGYGKFDGWLKAEFEWKRSTAYNFINVYERFGDCPNFEQLNIASSALYLLAAPSTDQETVDEALGLASAGEAITHAKAKEMVQRAVDQVHPRKAAPSAPQYKLSKSTQQNIFAQKNVLNPLMSSESAEHYTPALILEAVENCLGEIDLDPCSNDATTPNVPARRHFTKDIDGLKQTWTAKTIFMNPPYGRDIQYWVTKLVDSYQSGDVDEAIALVPARTDTRWFQILRDYPVCFVVGRLTFVNNNDAAPFPSAVFYLGEGVDRFYHAFYPIGDIWQKLNPELFGQ